MTKRTATRPVFVGGIQIGGGARVSVQSMTNTRTGDVAATLKQIEELKDEGCEIVRVAVKDGEDAKAIAKLKAAGLPLVADIHFDHRLAIAALESGVDKLRINPANIGADYKVKELCQRAKEHNVPIRIGINSGCMEKEVLQKHGGPNHRAMVESALNNAAMLEKFGFYDIVLAVKSSSVTETVQAYRLLSEKCGYPLHIGVTEVGGGMEGIVRSAVGIGALLLDGIGDTLRVSLTGSPIREVEAGKEILRAAQLRNDGLHLVCCPTCGRCGNVAKHTEIYEKVKLAFKRETAPITVAVMGCAVNGPGEAKEADIGVALGRTNAVLFKKGVQLGACNLDEAADLLIKSGKEIIQGGGDGR